MPKQIYRVPLALEVEAETAEEAYDTASAIVEAANYTGPIVFRASMTLCPLDEVKPWRDVVNA